MKENISYDLMEDYLQGFMSEEDKPNFEEKLAKDQFFRDEFELYKLIRSAQKNKKLTSFESTLQSVESTYFDEQKTGEKSKSNLKWLAGFTLIILVAVAAYFLSNESEPAKTPNPNTEQKIIYARLYDRFAKHDFAFQEMSTETNLSEIQNLLETGQYKNAFPKIDAYLIAHPDAAEIKLAKGIAFLETSQFEDALQTFTRVAAGHSLYINEVNWYLALTFLKQEDLQNTISFLEKIPESSSRYSDAENLKAALR